MIRSCKTPRWTSKKRHQTLLIWVHNSTRIHEDKTTSWTSLTKYSIRSVEERFSLLTEYENIRSFIWRYIYCTKDEVTTTRVHQECMWRWIYRENEYPGGFFCSFHTVCLFKSCTCTLDITHNAQVEEVIPCWICVRTFFFSWSQKQCFNAVWVFIWVYIYQ